MNVRLAVVPSLAAAVLLAGCSSSGSATVETPSGAGSATASSTSAAPSSEQSSSEQPSSDAGTSSASAPSSQQSSAAPATGLRAGLLTTADLGTGYTGGPQPSQEGSPMPCTPSKPSLDKQVPPTEEADAKFANTAERLQLSEGVTEYADEATAKRAFAAAVAGFSCPSGTIGKVTMKIVTKPAQAGRNTDELKAWDFGDGKTIKGTVVAGRVGNRFVGLTFVVPAAQDASGVNITDIVSKALTRAKQA